jgi:hypothetical protein
MSQFPSILLPIHYSLIIDTVQPELLAIYLHPILGIFVAFSFLIYTQSVGLLGREFSPLQDFCLNTNTE